jgi:NADH-quinone oxidoreductase subunit L
VDEIYRATFVALSLGFMNLFWLIDRWIVDGLVNLAGRVAAFFSWLDYLFDKYVVDGIINQTAEILGESADVLRLMQTGRVQNYLLIAITGAAFFALIFILKPT